MIFKANVYDQFEVFLIYLIAGLGLLLKNTFYRTILKNDLSSKSLIFVIDFAYAIVPMILAQTLLSQRIHSLIVTMLTIIVIMLAFDAISKKLRGSKQQLIYEIDSHLAVQTSVTWVRTMVFVSTSIAILAVDFDVFPQRFAKTLRFGHSLMDTGTGAFVFVNALSDFRASTELKRKRTPVLSFLHVRIPSFVLLLLMGIGRSVFIMFSGYQQSIDEYGVHWNFFITLFFLRTFVELFPYPYSMYIGLLVGCIYELGLTRFSGADFILRDEEIGRTGFIDQNREGIFSLCGYIFLYSLALLYAKVSTTALYRYKNLSLRRIFSHGLIFVVVFVVLQKGAEYWSGLGASRRLANMPYTFAMAALFAIAVSGLQVFIYFIGSPPKNWNIIKFGIVQAINRNGLLHFLLSNLVTGLINIILLKRFQFDTTMEMTCIFTYVFFTTLTIVLVNLRR